MGALGYCSRRGGGQGRRGAGFPVGDWARSVQAAAPQVVGDDDVGDGVEHHLDVSRVCGAGHVTVDLLVGRAVLALKLSLDVRRRVLVGVGPCRGAEGRLRLRATSDAL